MNVKYPKFYPNYDFRDHSCDFQLLAGLRNLTKKISEPNQNPVDLLKIYSDMPRLNSEIFKFLIGGIFAQKHEIHNQGDS